MRGSVIVRSGELVYQHVARSLAAYLPTLMPTLVGGIAPDFGTEFRCNERETAEHACIDDCNAARKTLSGTMQKERLMVQTVF
jgi:hypothetical protein